MVTERYVDELPSALAGLPLDGRRPALFLDYDGTLTPIVPDPDDAVLADEVRSSLERLAELVPVAIVSGRDRADVARLVGVDHLHFAGSHGFDISGPDGLSDQRGDEFRPALREAADLLDEAVAAVPGAWVQRKRYALAVHYRESPEGAEADLDPIVGEVVGRFPQLRVAGGKAIFEVRPDIDWDKGRAVLWLLEVMGVGDGSVPVYVGDDVTDEDAFRVLTDGTGIGVVVGTDHRPTHARFSLTDPGEVAVFLDGLIDAHDEQ